MRGMLTPRHTGDAGEEVLTEAQIEFASIWQAQGWTSVLAREGWEVAVQEKLNTAGAHP